MPDKVAVRIPVLESAQVSTPNVFTMGSYLNTYNAPAQSPFSSSVIYDDVRKMCIAPNNPVQLIAQLSVSSDRGPTTNIPAGITFGPNANKAVVSQYSINLLAEIMKASNNPNLTITSTLRTPEDQARAMYDNIISAGIDHELGLYGASGDRVVNVAGKAIKQKLSKEEVLKKMAEEIRKVGPGKVSRHAGDPAVINVIDISPRSVTNKKAFVREIKKKRIFLLQPPADLAYHLEIKQ